MRRSLLLLFALIGLLPAARAQVGSASGFCDQGATSAQTQGLASTNKLQGIIPSCTVSVYLTGTQTLATLYQNGTSTPLTNPFTASTAGQWTFWASILQGYDIVLSGGIAPNVYATPFTLLNRVPGFGGCGSQNGAVEASCFPGTDFATQLSEAAAALPSNGGIITAYGFGNSASTTQQILAQSSPSKPITVILNPATTFTLNTAFPSGTIATSVSTGVSGTSGACIWPIANGSALTSPGNSQLNGRLILGSSAATYDVLCNATQDGTQQSFQLDGLSVEGNASATMSGSLLHIRNTFAQTRVQNTTLYHPFGNAFTGEGGSDWNFVNDNFSDASGAGGYPGAVVTLTCTTNTNFEGGSIQDNGINNPLMILQGTSATAPGGCAAGHAVIGAHFYGVDYELQAATVGSFTGHATNVNPFQITDGQDILFDKMVVFGSKGAGQVHLVDLLSSGANGQTRGPIEIDNINALPSDWTGVPLVVNSANTIFVPASLRSVVGTTNGVWVGIGKYRWEGGGFVGDTVTDYLDQEIVADFQGMSTNGDINPTLLAGSDIGAQINNAPAQCSQQCKIVIPPGNYSYSTTISLPLNLYGKVTLTGSPGAVLTYTGTGDAIVTPVGTTGPTAAQLIIEGFELLGNGSATSGIHTYPSNRITIRNMMIEGFSAGDGIKVEGSNSSNIYDNLITNDLNGVHLIPTFCNSSSPYNCSPSNTGATPFTPNAVHILFNQITDNLHWGVWDDRDSVSVGLTGSLNNVIAWNDLELNGIGTSAYGAIFVMHSTGEVIEGNYFEGSPRRVVLGELGAGGALDTAGPVVENNYFTTQPPVSPSTTQYNIELENTTDADIHGNSEQGTPDISTATNCFINAATGGENRTIIGRNAIFQNSTEGSGNQICVNGTGVTMLAGNGSFTIMNPNYQSQIGYQNFAVNTAVTSETIAVTGLTSGGSCQIHPVAANSTGAQNGRSTIYAGTTYLSALSTGQVTLTHPSGEAIFVDLYCTFNPNGGFGTP